MINLVRRCQLYQIHVVHFQIKYRQMLLHLLTLLLQRPLRRVKLHENRRGRIYTWWTLNIAKWGKRLPPLEQLTCCGTTHKFLKLRWQNPQLDDLRMNIMISWRISLKKKEKNLKNCLAKRSRADHFCWAMSWTCRCESTSITFVNKGLPLILQW